LGFLLALTIALPSYIESSFLASGIIIISLAVLAIFFLGSTKLWLWALILFFSRVGAALIETMHDSYFFKQINHKDIDIINLFRNIDPFSCLIGSAFSLLVFNFFPIRFIFLFLAIISLTSLMPILTLKDSK
jgi:hypothetical protein